ncbi:MAG: hypothetical protein NC120_06100 [Ruminococcus sp.]|nr:hypothetical protein [Ruminococcus sp.]
MSKFYGAVGYSVTEQTSPGVWTERVSERSYYGDVTRNTRRMQTSGQVNPEITVSNQISVIADPFAYDNFHSIKYVHFMGSKWTVTDAEVSFPRLILTLGGVYNEQEDRAPEYS